MLMTRKWLTECLETWHDCLTYIIFLTYVCFYAQSQTWSQLWFHCSKLNESCRDLCGAGLPNLAGKNLVSFFMGVFFIPNESPSFGLLRCRKGLCYLIPLVRLCFSDCSPGNHELLWQMGIDQLIYFLSIKKYSQREEPLGLGDSGRREFLFHLDMI